jgi:UDP-N-acetylglucosamine:LPS N-acetylglucosamine transferase
MSSSKPTVKILTGGENRSDDQILAAHDSQFAHTLPGSDDSPLVIMELLQRLRVRDVMRDRDIISVTRDDSLRTAQQLMKSNKISGVPILEDKRLFGIISVNDIIKALEGGWIDESCRAHMATNLVVLEEDMPLAFAIKFFQNYTFGRFPVLNKNRDFVGIVSQRDLTRVLMKELTKEIAKLEGKVVPPEEQARSEGALPFYSMRQFVVVRNDLQNAGKAANEIRQLLKEKKIDRATARRELGLDERPLVLSFGGSLGAEKINNAMVTVLKNSMAAGDMQHIHATGKGNFDTFTAALGETSAAVQVREYIDDMPRCMAAADLVISRCGAMTLAELPIAAKPSILIPSPYVAENHQFFNAQVLVGRGAAVCIEEKDLSGDALWSAVETLVRDPEKRRAMAAGAASLAVPDATDRIYAAITDVLNA